MVLVDVVCKEKLFHSFHISFPFLLCLIKFSILPIAIILSIFFLHPRRASVRTLTMSTAGSIHYRKLPHPNFSVTKSSFFTIFPLGHAGTIDQPHRDLNPCKRYPPGSEALYLSLRWAGGRSNRNN